MFCLAKELPFSDLYFIAVVLLCYCFTVVVYFNRSPLRSLSEITSTIFSTTHPRCFGRNIIQMLVCGPVPPPVVLCLPLICLLKLTGIDTLIIWVMRNNLSILWSTWSCWFCVYFFVSATVCVLEPVYPRHKHKLKQLQSFLRFSPRSLHPNEGPAFDEVNMHYCLVKVLQLCNINDFSYNLKWEVLPVSNCCGQL